MVVVECAVAAVIPGKETMSPAWKPAPARVADTDAASLLILVAFCTSTVTEDGASAVAAAVVVAAAEVVGSSGALPLILVKNAFNCAGSVASASWLVEVSAPS